MITTPPKQRVMVCANILIAGMTRPRLLYEILQHAVMGDFQLVLSAYIVDEAREVICQLAPDQVQQFETILQAIDHEIVSGPTRDELLRAPHLARHREDLPVILAAVMAQVDCLISQDRDITDPSGPAHRYLRVELPVTFLRQSMGWKIDDLQRVRERNWHTLAQGSEDQVPAIAK